MRHPRSLDPAYFESLYRANPDPWGFESLPYEQAKYDDTLAALEGRRFGRVLEVGCSIGVLTARLAPLTDELVAVDVSETALERARMRCAALGHVRFRRMRMPAEMPDGTFDLILLSEVAYYWDTADLAASAAYLRASLRPKGWLLLVHFTGETDYPKSGDEAVTELDAHLRASFSHRTALRRARYRLDLWERSPGQA